jgi:hypothetical protein
VLATPFTFLLLPLTHFAFVATLGSSRVVAFAIIGLGGRFGPVDGVDFANFDNGLLAIGLEVAFLLRADPGVMRALLSVSLFNNKCKSSSTP